MVTVITVNQSCPVCTDNSQHQYVNYSGLNRQADRSIAEQQVRCNTIVDDNLHGAAYSPLMKTSFVTGANFGL